MDDPTPNAAAPAPAPASATDLGRSYAGLLDGASWDVDVPPTREPPAAPTPPPAPSAPPSPLRIIEALLFVGGAPLTAARACETVRGLTPVQFQQVIDALNRSYRQQGRPYWIQVQGPGYVLALRSRYRPVLARLYGPTREARLSTVAVDVLALVAYRQPATKQEIDSLRGADSGALLRQLVRHGLIAVVSRGEAGQREVAYGTTQRFLDLFQLTSLDDLPQTQDPQRL
jgi:segregation and condensation protein B